MIRMKARVSFQRRELRRQAREGSIRSLGHAAAAIRLTARRSIRQSARASAPGQPPHTRRGLLRRAILYFVEKGQERALIGPAHSFVGRSASAHEFGGRYMRQVYPKRPLMGPALMALVPRLPAFWANSIRP